MGGGNHCLSQWKTVMFGSWKKTRKEKGKRKTVFLFLETPGRGKRNFDPFLRYCGKRLKKQ